MNNKSSLFISLFIIINLKAYPVINIIAIYSIKLLMLNIYNPAIKNIF